MVIIRSLSLLLQCKLHEDENLRLAQYSLLPMTRTVPINEFLWVGGVGTIISSALNLVGQGISSQ